MDKQILPNFNRQAYLVKLNDLDFAQDEMDKFLNRAKEILNTICWHVESSAEPGLAPALLSEIFEMFSIKHKNLNYTQFVADLQTYLFNSWTIQHATYFCKWRQEIFKHTYFQTDDEFLPEEKTPAEQVLDLSGHDANLNIFDAETLIKKYKLPEEVEQALRQCAEVTK